MVIFVILTPLLLTLPTIAQSMTLPADYDNQGYLDQIQPEQNMCAENVDHDPDAFYDINCKAITIDEFGYVVGSYDWGFENISTDVASRELEGSDNTLYDDVYPDECNYQCGYPATIDYENGYSRWPWIGEVELTFDGHPEHKSIATLGPGNVYIFAGVFFTLPSLNMTIDIAVYQIKERVLFIDGYSHESNPWEIYYHESGNAHFGNYAQSANAFRTLSLLFLDKNRKWEEPTKTSPICIAERYQTEDGRQMLIMEQIGQYATEVPVEIVGITRCKSLYAEAFEGYALQEMILNSDGHAFCVKPADNLPHTIRLGSPVVTTNNEKYYLVGLVKFSFIHSSTIPQENRLPYIVAGITKRLKGIFKESRFPTFPWRDC